MTHRLAVASLGLIACIATPVAADADTRGQVAVPPALIEALGVAGYSGWEEIERDDGYWEVDDARDMSGAIYDLKLDDGFAIISRERDDDRAD